MDIDGKRDRFVRIAEQRTNHILDTLRLLGNCANKSNYEYSEEDVRKIFGAIERELRNTKNKFLGISDKPDRFKL